jgi:hypothetical protein
MSGVEKLLPLHDCTRSVWFTARSFVCNLVLRIASKMFGTMKIMINYGCPALFCQTTKSIPITHEFWLIDGNPDFSIRLWQIS